MKKIRIGSRSSPLAILQVEEILSLFDDKNISLEIDRRVYQTRGDKDKNTSLVENVHDDFFTDSLDEGLLTNEIDLAIHSAKDLPENLNGELSVFALTEAVDETDAFVGHKHLDELKAPARVGTSSLLRQGYIQKMNPDVELVDIRGTIDERICLIDSGEIDGIIVATAALKRLGKMDQVKDIMPWEATPLQGQLAIVGRRSDQDLKEIVSVLDIRKTYGHVTLVGAGPGDPELITLKAVNSLKRCDCVFYDYLAHKDILKHASKAQKIYVGKRKGKHSVSQASLCHLLREQVLQGKNIVRLKGGDPLVFGRGAEEISYLRSYHMSVDVIPGVSSAIAIPSGLGIPLTARGISSSVAFLSGHQQNDSSDEFALLDIPKVKTLVFLMGYTKLTVIIRSLLKESWSPDTPIMLVSKGTRFDEEIVLGTIGTIQDKVGGYDLESPILIVVGKTVEFYRFQHCKMTNILYTGTTPQKYKALGRIIHQPMIGISEKKMEVEYLKVLPEKLKNIHIIILTSRFAVKYFFKILESLDVKKESLRSIDFVVIGKDTADELNEHDYQYALIAQEETSSGLYQDMMEKYDLKGKNILFPRSSIANPFLKENLEKHGCSVEELAVYDNEKPEKRDLPPIKIDKILFTSPSTVHNFLKDYEKIPESWTILSKGPVTSKALEKEGYKSEVLLYG